MTTKTFYKILRAHEIAYSESRWTMVGELTITTEQGERVLKEDGNVIQVYSELKPNGDGSFHRELLETLAL